MSQKKPSQLTIQEKNELVEYWLVTKHNRNRLAEWIKVKFKIEIHPVSVSRILRKHKLQPDASSTAVRSRDVTFPEFESAILEWFLRTEKQMNLSDDLLLSKAQEFRPLSKINEDQLKLSSGWLQKFKLRNGIKSYYVHGEASSVDMESIKDELNSFKAKINEYDPEDVYNFDETGLF